MPPIASASAAAIAVRSDSAPLASGRSRFAGSPRSAATSMASFAR
jgi:hypothetical protein